MCGEQTEQALESVEQRVAGIDVGRVIDAVVEQLAARERVALVKARKRVPKGAGRIVEV
jgi:hypothetical protein